MCMDSLQDIYSTVRHNRLKQILAKSHAVCVEFDKTNFFAAIIVQLYSNTYSSVKIVDPEAEIICPMHLGHRAYLSGPYLPIAKR